MSESDGIGPRRTFPPDRNWDAVRDVVMNGLLDDEVRDHPPMTDEERATVADTITDHVVAAVELSKEQKQAAKARRQRP